MQVEGHADALARADAQVAVDFTVPAAATANLAWCAEHGVHAVVGTTGLDDDRPRGGWPAAFPPAAAVNCFVAPNFAIGAVLMMRFAELAAPWFDTAEIIELHHDAKVDAPSGTAVLTAERMAAASGSWDADPTDPGGRRGRPGRHAAPAASASTRSACAAWSPTRRSCSAPPGRA